MAAVLGYAILNVMRLNAARLNYGPATVYVTVGSAAMRARLAGAQVRDVINASPSSCTLRVSDTIPALVPAFVAPQPGQDLAVKVGTTAPQSAIFTGQVLRRTQVKEGLPTNPPAFDLEGIDYTWQLDRRLVFKSYPPASASAIAADVLAWFAPGFTTAIEPGLPPITLPPFTGQPVSECLSQIVNAFGGRWKVIAKVVHVFQSAIHLPAPDLVTPATVSDFVETIDLAQLRTRVYVKGIGVAVTEPAPIGSPTITVADTTPFADAPGGTVITDDGQIVKYTGKQAAGYAPGVPPGTSAIVAPPPAPVPIPAYDVPALDLNFAAFTTGQAFHRVVTTAPHGFAVGQLAIITGQPFINGNRPVTAIVSATEFQIAAVTGGGSWTNNGGTVRLGQSISSIRTRNGIATVTTDQPHGLAAGADFTIWYASPTAYVGPHTIATVPSPTTFTYSQGGIPADAGASALVKSSSGPLIGSYNYEATFASSSAESLPSAPSAAVVVAVVPNLPAVSTFLSVVGTTGGPLSQFNSWYYGFTAVTRDGETIPIAAKFTLASGQTGFAISFVLNYVPDPRILSVNVWRSTMAPGALPASGLQYVGNIPIKYDGSAMSLNDLVSDANLGGPPPAANTAGGAILVGGLALGDPRVTSRRIYRNTAAAPTVYRQAGELADNTGSAWFDRQLDTALAAPAPTVAGQFGAPGQLTGVPPLTTGAIFYPLPAGSRVAIWVQRDDTAAQTAIAALEGGDGIHESRLDDPTIATVAAATAAGDADLKLFRTAEAKCTFSGRDPKLQAGATATVNFGPPTNISKSYVIQSVTTSEIGVAGALAPKRTVEAATTRYTLDDLLRRVALLENRG
jgi:hypothetical protein